MSVTSGFFNSRNHDRLYNAEEMGRIFDGIIKDGVYESIGDRFVVTEREGLTVSVGTGRAWFNNAWIRNDSPIVLELEDPPQVLSRIDTIVIDVNFKAEVRAADIIVVSGTPSSSPKPSTLIHEVQHNQYPLAHILIYSNMTKIEQKDITSCIGTTECPFVVGLMEHGNIQSLVTQWTTQLNDLVEELKNMIAQAAAHSLIDNSVTESKIANGAVSQVYTATIPSSGDGKWTGSSSPYRTTINVTGLRSSDRPIIDMIPDSSISVAEAQMDGYGMMIKFVAGTNTLDVYATDKPDTRIPIQIMAVRK